MGTSRYDRFSERLERRVTIVESDNPAAASIIGSARLKLVLVLSDSRPP